MWKLITISVQECNFQTQIDIMNYQKKSLVYELQVNDNTILLHNPML